MSDKAVFYASIPPIMSALKIGGDNGARLQLQIDDTGLAEVLKLTLWRDKLLKVTIEPAKDG